MFKPKLCCILDPEVICHCKYSLCLTHVNKMNEHFSERPNTPYYYHCANNPLLVVWHDTQSKPATYRLAFYEDQETKEDTCTEVVGSFEPRYKGHSRQKKVPKSKREK